MIIGLLGKARSGKDTVASMIAPTHLVWMDGGWVDIDMLVHEVDAMQRKKAALKGRAVQLALADPLKVICREVYDFSYMQLWGPSDERNAPDTRYRDFCPVCAGLGFFDESGEPDRNGPTRCSDCRDGVVHVLTPREALQTLGTEWGRRCYANTWVDLGLRRAGELVNGHRIRRPSNVEHFAASYVIDHTDLVLFSDIRFANEVKAIREAGGVVWKVARSASGLSGKAGAHVSETEQDGIDEALFDQIIVNDGTLDDLRLHCAALL